MKAMKVCDDISDLVEIGRSLGIAVTDTKMIRLQITAKRDIARDGSFLLDSEDVEDIIKALLAARDSVRGR